MAIPTLSAATIPAGGVIPKMHTAKGQKASPALNWRRIPPGRPYLTIVIRSWLVPERKEIVHWLLYDIPEFLGGIEQDVKQSSGWTTGLNSDGNARYLPFAATDPRRVRFDMFASRQPTGLDGPTSWDEIAKLLKTGNALGPFGFEAYDASLPALMGVSG